MKKRLPFLFVAILMVLTANAQKPKATFEFEAFAKKSVQYMNVGIAAMCAKDPELEYIATTTGKPLEEVKAQFEANKNVVIADVDFLNKNGIARIFDKAELNVTQETPIKIADIICYCHYKEKAFTLTLTNCVQTNTTWVMGDGVEPKGDGIADLIALKKSKGETFANSGLGKMAAAAAADKAAQAKKDSIDETVKTKNDSVTRRATDAQRLADRIASAKAGNIRKGYHATLFPEHDNLNYSPYYHTEAFGQYLPGYYVDRAGQTVYVDKIKYSDPFTMMLGPLLEPPLTDFKNIAAYAVGDQLYTQFKPGTEIAIMGFSMGDAPALPPWALVVDEGAIRKLVSAHKVGGNVSGVTLSGVSADRMFQKLDENVVTLSSMITQYKKRMAVLVGDNAEMAVKIEKGVDGYRYENLDNILLEYNAWYDKQYPGKVKYLTLPANEPTELVPLQDNYVTLASKEDLKNYLAKKVWEPVSVITYDRKNNRTAQATITGVTRVTSADRYYTYSFSADGNLFTQGSPATWDTKDAKTVTVNGVNQMTNIMHVTTSTFVADVKRNGMAGTETIMYRVKGP